MFLIQTNIEGLMMEDDIVKLVQAIMPELVWKGAKDELCPVNSHRASVAFLCAIVTAIVKNKLHWSGAFFINSNSYFAASYTAFEFVCRQAGDDNPLDTEFMKAVKYLFEPQDLQCR